MYIQPRHTASTTYNGRGRRRGRRHSYVDTHLGSLFVGVLVVHAVHVCEKDEHLGVHLGTQRQEAWKGITRRNVYVSAG